MFYTILFIAIAALSLTYIFNYILKNPGPWKSFWVFLAVVFIGMFAFSLWVPPMGPIWYGIAWLDSLLVGLVLALLLGAASEASNRNFIRNSKGEVDVVAEAKSENNPMILFGIFFWLFIVVMTTIIIFGLVRLFKVI